MLDATELARRIRDAMDRRQPKLTSAALAKLCGVTPQAVYEWRKTGRVSKGYLEKIAAETSRPLEYFLGSEPGKVVANYGITLTLEEAEAIKRLQKAMPDWRLYVLGLAMVDNHATQRTLLDTMRQAVPDRRVEQHVPVAPHAAARAKKREKQPK
jgi:transcriptional regulator with XRE-family HTH domain